MVSPSHIVNKHVKKWKREKNRNCYTEKKCDGKICVMDEEKSEQSINCKRIIHPRDNDWIFFLFLLCLTIKNEQGIEPFKRHNVSQATK